MANIIGRVHKLGKQNRKLSNMTTNITTVPFSISFCHNADDKNIDMTLNPSYNNTMSYTNTADVHEYPVDTIEK